MNTKVRIIKIRKIQKSTENIVYSILAHTETRAVNIFTYISHFSMLL